MRGYIQENGEQGEEAGYHDSAGNEENIGKEFYIASSNW